MGIITGIIAAISAVGNLLSSIIQAAVNFVIDKLPSILGLVVVGLALWFLFGMIF